MKNRHDLSARPRRVISLAAVAVAVALMGCTGDGDDKGDSGDDKGPTTEAAASTTTTEAGAIDPANVSPDDLPEVPQIEDAVGIRPDVEVEECAETQPLVASGTATNSSDAPADLLIVINWTNDRGDVLARGVHTAEGVAAGETAEWSAEAESDADGPFQCVVNARRGALAG